MIFSRRGHLIAVGQQRGVDSVETELTIVVELTRKEDGLDGLRVTHNLGTRMFVGAVLLQAYNLVFTIHVGPDRLVSRVVILNAAIIRGSIVDGSVGLKAQSLEHLVEIEVNACIKLQLTARKGVVSGGVHACKGIGLQTLRTTEHVPSINDVVAVGHHLLHVSHVWIHHIDRDQRCERVLCGRTQSSALIPVVATVSTLVIEGCVGIYPTRNPVVEPHVDVAAYVEAVGVVVLPLTKLDEVADMVEANISIEVGEASTALKLGIAIVAVVGLFQIVA